MIQIHKFLWYFADFPEFFWVLFFCKYEAVKAGGGFIFYKKPFLPRIQFRPLGCQKARTRFWKKCQEIYSDHVSRLLQRLMGHPVHTIYHNFSHCSTMTTFKMCRTIFLTQNVCGFMASFRKLLHFGTNNNACQHNSLG